MRLSSRVPPGAARNELTRSLARVRAAGASVADLTESNPTRVELPYPASLLAPLGQSRGLLYEPAPLGMPEAREAVAADQRRRGATVDPDDVVLTASTSEAYSWLFKLLCEPGEAVLVPRPSYPLFDYLARGEGVATHAYALRFHGRWEVDLSTVESRAARRQGACRRVAQQPHRVLPGCAGGARAPGRCVAGEGGR